MLRHKLRHKLRHNHLRQKTHSKTSLSQSWMSHVLRISPVAIGHRWSDGQIHGTAIATQNQGEDAWGKLCKVLQNKQQLDQSATKCYKLSIDEFATSHGAWAQQNGEQGSTSTAATKSFSFCRSTWQLVKMFMARVSIDSIIFGKYWILVLHPWLWLSCEADWQVPVGVETPPGLSRWRLWIFGL